MDIKRAELHIPIVGRNKADCEDCPDRFVCWTDNCLILYADYQTITMNGNEKVLKLGFTIRDSSFMRDCIKPDALFSAVAGHNVKKSLFYSDFNLLVRSYSLTADFKDISHKLVIEAKVL